jgi:hypothetical protein
MEILSRVERREEMSLDDCMREHPPSSPFHIERRARNSAWALSVRMYVYGVAIVQTRLFFVATPAHVMIGGHCRP